MKPTLKQRFRYYFDNLMSRGTPAMIGMLFVLSLIVVFVAGAVISATGFVQEGELGRLSLGEAMWESLMRTRILGPWVVTSVLAFVSSCCL